MALKNHFQLRINDCLFQVKLHLTGKKKQEINFVLLLNFIY
jgi:hypothetical protein